MIWKAGKLWNRSKVDLTQVWSQSPLVLWCLLTVPTVETRGFILGPVSYFRTSFCSYVNVIFCIIRIVNLPTLNFFLNWYVICSPELIQKLLYILRYFYKERRFKWPLIDPFVNFYFNSKIWNMWNVCTPNLVIYWVFCDDLLLSLESVLFILGFWAIYMLQKPSSLWTEYLMPLLTWTQRMSLMFP